MRRSYNAVVERNVEWSGVFQSEPYECGWAAEAIFFIRSLKGDGQGTARVEISPDGMRWCAEGVSVELPAEGQVTFCRVSRFGNWLRLAGETRRPLTVLVTLSLKE